MIDTCPDCNPPRGIQTKGEGSTGDAKAMIDKLAEVAAAVGWGSGEPAVEMAGHLVSFLYANPEHIDRFLAEGSEIMIDGTFSFEAGALTYRANNGQILTPRELRESKGLSQ